jgi:hypothetical protein
MAIAVVALAAAEEVAVCVRLRRDAICFVALLFFAVRPTASHDCHLANLNTVKTFINSLGGINV